MPEITLAETDFRQVVAEFPPADRERALRALEFAKECHALQERLSGDPYIIHPIEVSLQLYRDYGDIEMLIAGLLHDILEDCREVTAESLHEQFGDIAGFLVDAVSKNRTGFVRYPEKDFSEKIERILWAGMQDVRVLLLKIADRDNNLATLRNLKNEKQIRMTFETQAIYKPLREILAVESREPLARKTERLQQFLADKKIPDEKEFKTYILSLAFHDVDSNLFDILYRDTGSIVWRIENYDLYCRMIELPGIDDKIKTVRLAGNSHWFEGDFTFTSGAVIEDSEIRMRPYSYSSRK